MTPDTALSEPSRTQAERTAAMRPRLLDAAIDSLVEFGYAGTTTKGITRSADVSRVAQLHHFPTKKPLVVAAVEHLLDRRTGEILDAEPGGLAAPGLFRTAEEEKSARARLLPVRESKVEKS